MPTEDCKAHIATQVAVIVMWLFGIIVSPALWGGLLGAAFGIAFGKKVKFIWEGLLWLAFGMVVAYFSNQFLLSTFTTLGAGFAALIASFSIAYYKESIFTWLASRIKNLIGDGNAQ